jgi:hypothetical protein
MVEKVGMKIPSLSASLLLLEETTGQWRAYY